MRNIVYFKRTFTNLIFYSEVNMIWTIREFILEIESILMRPFLVQPGEKMEFIPMYSICHVENTENSPAWQPSDELLFNRYRTNQFFGFYVRIIPEILVEIARHTDCIICAEQVESPMIHYYHCNHSQMCGACFQRCCSSGILSCPICRASSSILNLLNQNV